jgi:hypothetical protein
MGTCPSLHKKRGPKKYTLSVSCPNCYKGVENLIFKEKPGKIPGCIAWNLPKKPKGRSTPAQRSQYYGWHLILEHNLKHNAVPKETSQILNKLFYKRVKPSKQQVNMLVRSFSKDSKRPALVVRTLLEQLIKDTKTVQQYSKDAGFTPRAQKLFKLHCNEFIIMVKELRSKL